MLRKLLTIITVFTVLFSVFPAAANAEEIAEEQPLEEVVEELPESETPQEDLPAEVLETEAADQVSSIAGTAYAVYTADQELIFFRSYNQYANNTETNAVDIKGNTYSGLVFSGMESQIYATPADVPWLADTVRSNAKTIRIAGEQTIKPISTKYWFCRMKNVSEIDLCGLDTSEVTNMSYMFEGCSGLSALNLGGMNTAKVTDMYYMFSGCSELSSLDVSSFQTGRVTNMGYMFDKCKKVPKLDVSGFDTQNVTNMCRMFEGCRRVTDFDLSGFDTANVTTMTGMFVGCDGLVRLDLGSFNTSKVTSMNAMFSGCENLNYVNLSSFDTKNVTDMASMFSTCNDLLALDLRGFDTSSVTSMRSMFSMCFDLTSLDITSFDTSKVTEMDWMFDETTSLERIYVSERWNTEAAKTSYHMFANCKKLPNFDKNYINITRAYYGGDGLGYLTYKQYSPAEKLTLNQTNLDLLSGNTRKLTASAAVMWSSSDGSVASVDYNGTVKGVKPGYAVIYAIAPDGRIVTCRVRVLFTDIPAEGKYYSAPVYWAVENGITNGYTDSDGVIRTFKPQNNCTREAVVTFLWRLAGKPEPKNMNSPFSDVQDRNKYYYKAVLWAAENGIAKGYSNGTFRPGDTCLREHVVTFLWRYAKSPNPQTSRNPFNDVKTSDYFYKAAIWANENGIAKGYTSGAHAGGFGPKLDCLREHVVTFLYRYAK